MVREVLSLRELILELKKIIDIPEADLDIHCALFEDNIGVEYLVKAPKNRPRTKQVAVKYHQFREAVRNSTLKVIHVYTIEHLADICIKILSKQSLE